MIVGLFTSASYNQPTQTIPCCVVRSIGRSRAPRCRRTATTARRFAIFSIHTRATSCFKSRRRTYSPRRWVFCISRIARGWRCSFVATPSAVSPAASCMCRANAIPARPGDASAESWATRFKGRRRSDRPISMRRFWRASISSSRPAPGACRSSISPPPKRRSPPRREPGAICWGARSATIRPMATARASFAAIATRFRPIIPSA